MDIDELKKITANAREAQRVEQAEKEKQEKERLERLAEEHRLKADHIIAMIPSKCKRAAEAGLDYVKIMPAESDGTLKGVADLVWQFCVDSNLNPTLEHWHDGVGITGGYDIVVHW